MTARSRSIPCALVLALLVAPAWGDTLTWPTGPPPCDDINDLETCLNGATSGDIVEVAADAIPGQTVAVSPGKSLTLRPAAGFVPVFGDFTSIFFLGGDDDITVVVEGITIVRGGFSARQGGEGTFDVTFRDNTVQQVFSSGTAFNVDSGNVEPPYGPTLFLIENNQVTIDVAPTDTVSAISVGGFQGDGNVGTIVGNVIDQVGGDQQSAIGIANGNVTLQVDVIANQISGDDFNAGVSVFQFSNDGSVTARIINNTISGQVDEAGLPGGIALNVSGGFAEFLVVNNTVAFNENGLQLSGRPDLGATASVLIANNIFAFNDEDGIDIGEFEATTINEDNLVFGNGSNFFTPGPGTITADPLFVSPADLRTEPGSPARDSGSNARVPADITTDVIGSPRILGVVDMGAFELSAGPFVLEIPTLSWLGLAALVGLLIAAAWRRLL